MPVPFHLAIPVHSIEAARSFYGGILGLAEGRSSDQWIDWDFFGHQVVTHQVAAAVGDPPAVKGHNPVDGHQVPVPHFGVVLGMQAFDVLAERLRAAKVTFEIEPYIRFKGLPGEQATMFLRDPSGNALEFKAFADLSQLFAR